VSEQKARKAVEPLFELREYEAELFAPIERRVEVKAERAEEVELMPDMGSMIEGIMQPMMMMLTLGMVMPVMQQAMVGVLQSTEVTVVVKPGSIVSVEVTNSVLAVEVEGGNVNVTLEHSTIMLPVDLQGSTIMMPIDIQGATIMMPVDIQAQYVDLNVVITGQVGNVRISIQEVAGDVIFNVAQSGEWNVYVETKSGVAINIKTEADVVINIHTPLGEWVTKAEASSFSEVRESYWPISPDSQLVIHVIDGDRGVLRTIGFIIAWDDLTYLLDVYQQLRIEVYADQSPYDPGATPVWQSTSVGVDLLSGGYIVGGRIHNLLDTNAVNKLTASSNRGGLTWAYVNNNGYITVCGGYVRINVECMSDLYVVFKNLHSGETIRLWYAIEYGVYP